MSNKYEATFHPEGQITPTPAENEPHSPDQGSRALPDATGVGEALVQQIAEAIGLAADDCGPHEPANVTFARAVLPLVEAQVAPLRDEVRRAEHYRTQYEARANRAEMVALAAESALRQVRELADKWRTDRLAYPLDDARASVAFITVKACEEEPLRVLARVGAADTQPEGVGDCDNNTHVCSCGTLDHFHSGDCNIWLNDEPALQRAHWGKSPTAGGKVDTAPEAEPVGREHWEYGVETRKAYNNFEPTIEWGASVGMTHRYEYTAESVHALAGGNPVWRRLRTSYADVIGEPEPFPRPTADTAPESGEGR